MVFFGGYGICNREAKKLADRKPRDLAAHLQQVALHGVRSASQNALPNVVPIGRGEQRRIKGAAQKFCAIEIAEQNEIAQRCRRPGVLPGNGLAVGPEFLSLVLTS